MFYKQLLTHFHKKLFPFTHKIVVGVNNTSSQPQWGFSISNIENSSISPNTITFSNAAPDISALVTHNSGAVTRLFLDINQQMDVLFLARSDTGIQYGSSGGFWNDTGFVDYDWQNLIFTPLDIRKEIPIWLSTTPPPWLQPQGIFTFDDKSSGAKIKLINGSVVNVPYHNQSRYSCKDIDRIFPGYDSMNVGSQNILLHHEDGGGGMGRYYTIIDKSIDAYLAFGSAGNGGTN